jgi:hypothetical protein
MMKKSEVKNQKTVEEAFGREKSVFDLFFALHPSFANKHDENITLVTPECFYRGSSSGFVWIPA